MLSLGDGTDAHNKVAKPIDHPMNATCEKTKEVEFPKTSGSKLRQSAPSGVCQKRFTAYVKPFGTTRACSARTCERLACMKSLSLRLTVGNCSGNQSGDLRQTRRHSNVGSGDASAPGQPHTVLQNGNVLEQVMLGHWC